MKTLSLTLVLLIVALPARAAKQVTVAELQAIITGARGASDTDLAGQLSGLELTQRISESTLAHLKSGLPGPQSVDELSILAAESSFLDLPSSEIPATPAPALAVQRQVMSQVVTYVTKTIQRLPDFTARRETHAFEDRPAGEFSYLPLHPTTSGSASVEYRDGHEVDQSSGGKNVDATAGLVSWGEFGPILTTVLLDAAQNHLAWSHWEQGDSGPVAVFGYSVSGSKSHYQIRFCCTEDPAYATTTRTSAREINIFHQFVPYHGEIAVDPVSGAILRITVIADLTPGDPLLTASIAVRYGTVDIGGRSYICPLQANALARQEELPRTIGAIPSAALRKGPVITRLNEITFDDYHVFRGESRILTANGTSPGAAEEPPGSASPAGSQSAPAPAGEAPAGASPPVVAESPASTPAELVPSPAAAASSGALPPTQATPSAAARATAETAAVTPAPASSGSATLANTPASDLRNVPVFHANVREVLLDVVVSKKNGDPVPGLPRQDFTVADDGNTQTIDFFEEHAQGASQAAPPVMPQLPPGAATNAPTASKSSALYVLLLDSLNSEPQDQLFTHQEVLSFLHTMPPGTQVAVFALGMHLRLLQGFTTDPALLLAAVSGKGAEREAMVQNRSDNAADAADMQAFQTMRAGPAGIAAMRASLANVNAYSFESRTGMTFQALNALARYLEGIPGRKNLVWFSTSFPVTLFPTPRQLTTLQHSSNLPGYMNQVKQTANLFTLSQIAVYPVSSAGLMTSDVGLADSSNAGSGRARPTAAPTASAIQDASAFASMEQLAASTGGKAFATNDIDGTLHRIVHDSEDYYTLGYSLPNSAMDGSFHRIDVKVAPGRYKLAYREGYNATSGAMPDAASSENPISPLLGLGLPSATGILYGLRAVPSAQRGSEVAGQNTSLTGNLTRYSVQFTIRAQDLAFGQAPDGTRIAKLVIGVKAYGQDGSALNWLAMREAVELAPSEYEPILKSGIPVHLDLDLPASTTAQLITAVYDFNSGRAGTLEIPIRP